MRALFSCSGPRTASPTPSIRALRGRGQRLYGSSVAVLAGKGNNGGDGLFAAALLARRGMRTTAVLTAGAAHDAGLAAFRKAGGHAVALTGDNVAELAAMAGGADVVIDAVLGTGAQGGLRGPAAELVEALERSRPAPVRWWPATSPAASTRTRERRTRRCWRAD